jgi:hypothetical protein
MNNVHPAFIETDIDNVRGAFSGRSKIAARYTPIARIDAA